MKYLIILSTILLILSCQQSEKDFTWRYEIKGYVNYKGEKHEAVWLTDTIELYENYVTYRNSDGSRVVITSPFVLIDHKYDKVIKDID